MVKKEAVQRRSSVRRSAVGTGTTSLLMIFTVLCFATLAMLSLSTAASHGRIQERGFTGSKNLAEAKGATAAEVAELDALLAALQEKYPLQQNEKAYYEEARALAAQRGWEVNEDGATVLWRQDMDETSLLLTELKLVAPAGGARYEVVRQVSQITQGWQPEEGGGQLWLP